TRVFDGNLVFDYKIGIPILESYFMFRLNSFKQIYYHKTSRAAQIMIYNALENRKEEFSLGVFDEPEEFLKWDDYTLWTTIQDDPFIQKLKRRNLLKMVYEHGNLSDERNIKKLSNVELKSLEVEIAHSAGVDENDVFIDVPYLSTVPYAHATSFDPDDVPVYLRKKGMVKKLSELSPLFSLLKGHYNIIRVYTWKQLREKVAAAAAKIFN
ncbi:MAG: hypothetical protein ACTSRA_04190, partial [Promethearchaeota archaeon]